MKKRISLFLILIASMTFIYAGPFGLSNGMTLDEVTQACGGNCPQRMENDDRYVIQPEKSHSMFTYYVAWISEDYGLYKIRAASDAIETNDYGVELKTAFYSFEERLEKIYGKPIVVDALTDPTTSFRTENYWLYTLEKGARELYAVWNLKNEDATLKDELDSVSLWGACVGYNKTFLLIDYNFINQEKVENQEDEVL